MMGIDDQRLFHAFSRLSTVNDAGAGVQEIPVVQVNSTIQLVSGLLFLGRRFVCNFVLVLFVELITLPMHP